MSHELKQFIAEMRARGHDDVQIRKDMLEAGWDPAYVAEIPHMGDGSRVKRAGHNIAPLLPFIAGALIVLAGGLIAFGVQNNWFGAREGDGDNMMQPDTRLVYEFPQALNESGQGACPSEGTFDVQDDVPVGQDGLFPRFRCGIDDRFTISVQWERDADHPGDPTAGRYRVVLLDANLEEPTELFVREGLLDPVGGLEYFMLRRIGNWHLEIAWAGSDAFGDVRSAKVIDLADRLVVADVNWFGESVVVWQNGRQALAELVTDFTCRADAADTISVTGLTLNEAPFTNLEPPYRFFVRAGEWDGTGPCPGMPVFSEPAYADDFSAITFSAGSLGTLSVETDTGAARFDRQLVNGEPVTGETLAVQWEEEVDGLSYREALLPFSERWLPDAVFRYAPPLQPWQGDGIICEGTDCAFELFGALPGSDDEGNPGVYQLGSVSGGRYDGATLLLIEEHCSLCVASRSRMLLTPQGDLIRLGRYSNALVGNLPPNAAPWERDYLADYIETDDTVLIPDLTPPPVLTIPRSPVQLVLKPSPHQLLDEWSGQRRTLFTDTAHGEVFEDPETNDIGLELADGTVATYALAMPFMQAQGDGSFSLNATRIADNGGAAPAEMRYHAGERYPYTCSASEAVFVVSPFNPAAFESFATTAGAGTLYRYADAANTVSLETPGDFFTRPNTLFRQQNPDPTMEQFLAIEPLFVWQDPFGRAIQIRNDLLKPSAGGCDGGTFPTPLAPLPS